MKKFLPLRLSSIAQGFTLIELLVVIAIIAILAVIGMAVYSGLQKGARDTTRKADIDAIAQAYEENYNPAAGTYSSISGSQFTQGTVPKDPNGTDYNKVDGPDISPPNNRAFKVCAVLEGGSEPYCRSNQQGPPSTVDFTYGTPYGTPIANESPICTAINGPDSLNTSQLGSYTATASDPEGDALTYSWTASSGTPTSGTSATFDWTNASMCYSVMSDPHNNHCMRIA